MATDLAEQESAFARRRRLYSYIQHGHLGKEVLSDLLPEGRAHLYEKDLWDYKEELPTRPTAGKPTEADKFAYELKLAEIIKDAVAFYNSYGGYLVGRR